MSGSAEMQLSPARKPRFAAREYVMPPRIKAWLLDQCSRLAEGRITDAEQLPQPAEEDATATIALIKTTSAEQQSAGLLPPPQLVDWDEAIALTVLLTPQPAEEGESLAHVLSPPAEEDQATEAIQVPQPADNREAIAVAELQPAGDKGTTADVLSQPAMELAEPELEDKGWQRQKMRGKRTKKDKCREKSPRNEEEQQAGFAVRVDAHAASPGREEARTPPDGQAPAGSQSQLGDPSNPQPSDKAHPLHLVGAGPDQPDLTTRVPIRMGGKKSKAARRQAKSNKSPSGPSHPSTLDQLRDGPQAGPSELATTKPGPEELADLPGSPPQSSLNLPQGGRDQDSPDHLDSVKPEIHKASLAIRPATRPATVNVLDGQVDRPADAKSPRSIDNESQALPVATNLVTGRTAVSHIGILDPQLKSHSPVLMAPEWPSASRPVLGLDHGWDRTLPPLERTDPTQPSANQYADEQLSVESKSEASPETQSPEYPAGESLGSVPNSTADLFLQHFETRPDSEINNVHKANRKPRIDTSPASKGATTQRVLRWNNVPTVRAQAIHARTIDQDARWRQLRSSSLNGITTAMQRGELTDSSMFGPVLDGEITPYAEKKAIPVPNAHTHEACWLPLRHVAFRSYGWQNHLAGMTFDQYEVCKQWEQIAGKYRLRGADPPEQPKQPKHKDLLDTEPQLEHIGECIAHYADNPGFEQELKVLSDTLKNLSVWADSVAHVLENRASEQEAPSSELHREDGQQGQQSDADVGVGSSTLGDRGDSIGMQPLPEK